MTYLIDAGALLIIGQLSIIGVVIWAIWTGRLIINKRSPKPNLVKPTCPDKPKPVINKPKVVYGEFSEISEINEEVESEVEMPRW